MFNIGAGEFLVILVVALVVLGPERLPGAMRKVGSVIAELRKMSAGFQEELREALDEPMRDLQSTADLFRNPLTALADAAEAAAAREAAEAAATETVVEPAPADPFAPPSGAPASMAPPTPEASSGPLEDTPEPPPPPAAPSFPPPPATNPIKPAVPVTEPDA